MTIYKCYIDIVFRSKKNFEQQKFIVESQNHDNLKKNSSFNIIFPSKKNFELQKFIVKLQYHDN